VLKLLNWKLKMNETKKLKIGVIGAGWFASRRHIPAVVASKNAELVALCRRNIEQLMKMAQYFGVKNTFTDYREMINSVEMDGVIITTPHALHYEQARYCLNKGLHVLIEKPMAITAEEARDLVATADEKKRIIVVGLNPPYWAYCHFLKNLIESGRLGVIEAISINWVGDVGHVFGKIPMPDSLPGIVPPTLFRADPKLGGGGHLVDTGSHLVSEILWTTGLKATEVTASMDNVDMDMRCTVGIRLDNPLAPFDKGDNVLCSISMVGDSKIRRRIHNVYLGSKSTVFVDGLPFKVTVLEPDKEPVMTAEDQMSKVVEPVDNFIDAIMGKAKPLASGVDGLRVVEVIESAYKAAKMKQVITLEN
jgi:predicted dehydrogenase